MVSEEEFVVAMLCAIAFGTWTLYLLLRTRSLKKRLKAELQRSLQFARAAAPPAALPQQPARDEDIMELRKRIQVLERITVEQEHSLSREIEELRVR